MDKQIQIFDSKTIAIILGVKNIRTIEARGKLAERLIQKNCRLIEKFTEGKKSMYKVEIIKEKVELSFKEICNKHKIKKQEAFKSHTKNRYHSIKQENSLNTKSQFAKEIKENIYDITKFDNVLMEEKFMKKDGFVYLKYNNGKFIGETSKETYNKFWQEHFLEKKEINSLSKRFRNGELSEDEYYVLRQIIQEKLNRKGEVYHKVSKYVASEMFEKMYKKINLEENKCII